MKDQWRINDVERVRTIPPFFQWRSRPTAKATERHPRHEKNESFVSWRRCFSVDLKGSIDTKIEKWWESQIRWIEISESTYVNLSFFFILWLKPPRPGRPLLSRKAPTPRQQRNSAVGGWSCFMSWMSSIHINPVTFCTMHNHDLCPMLQPFLWVSCDDGKQFWLMAQVDLALTSESSESNN